MIDREFGQYLPIFVEKAFPSQMFPMDSFKMDTLNEMDYLPNYFFFLTFKVIYGALHPVTSLQLSSSISIPS